MGYSQEPHKLLVERAGQGLGMWLRHFQAPFSFMGNFQGRSCKTSGRVLIERAGKEVWQQCSGCGSRRGSILW